MDDKLRYDLTEVYHQIMWLARQDNVSVANARAWYTAVMSNRVKTRIRLFSGCVSEEAVEAEGSQCHLEHYKRLSMNLTELIRQHHDQRRNAADEFVRLLIDNERVHIVTGRENGAIKNCGGNYKQAGVVLRQWPKIDAKAQRILWQTRLRRQVANADEYAPPE